MSADWKGLSHDILKQAFAFCDKGALTRCARTCKNWTDPALDLVWVELRIEDFEHIFAILAPLQPIPEQPSNSVTLLKFSRRINHLDWKRFMPYASRVKSINGFYRHESYRVLSESAHADLLLTKPPMGPLFPRVRSLGVDGQVIPDFPWFQVFIGLLHEGLQALGIFVTEFSPDEVVDFLEEVVWRSPNVTRLQIEAHLDALDGGPGNSLSSSIAKQHRLTSVIVSHRLLNWQLLSALEQLPNLREVLFPYAKHSFRARLAPNNVLPQSIVPNAFPQLTTLVLRCSLGGLHRYLSQAVGRGVAPWLQKLTILVVSTFKSTNFRDCLLKIAELFPLLDSLYIVPDMDLGILERGINAGASVREPLNHRALVPLSELRSLQSFILQCDSVLSLTNNELCTLLSQCPSLKHLVLNHEPMFLSPTELTIGVLPMLAESCPQLEGLSLFVNTNIEDPGSEPLRSFESLECINFGLSPVHDKHLIAKLLAQVLPEGCEVISSPLYCLEVDELLATGQEEKETREARRKEWVHISEWIPALLDFHREASARTAAKQAAGQI